MEPLISRYQFLIVEECGVCINKVVCEIKLTGSMAPVVKIPNFNLRFCNLGLVVYRGQILSKVLNTRFSNKPCGGYREWKFGTSIQPKHLAMHNSPLGGEQVQKSVKGL